MSLLLWAMGLCIGLGGCATPESPAKPATVAEVVELAKKHYPDINFDVPAPVEVTFSGNNDEVWAGIADTLKGMDERLAVVDKKHGIIQTVKNNLNEENWIKQSLGKATFVYEFDITLRPASKGVVVNTAVPFWEEKMLRDEERTSIPEGANMMLHIFYWNMAQKAKPLFARMSDRPEQNILYVPSNQMGQDSDATRVADSNPAKTTAAFVMPDDPVEALKQVQQRLSDLGYKPGPVDGIMGKRTVRALRKFQRDNHLAVTGKADGETVSRLFNVQ